VAIDLTDIKGASTKSGHPAPYPVGLAERLIRMFSFAGDTVLDPFAGTGSTSLAALACGRNSIANEIEQTYLKMARSSLLAASSRGAAVGAIQSTVTLDKNVKRHSNVGRHSEEVTHVALPVVGALP